MQCQWPQICFVFLAKRIACLPSQLCGKSSEQLPSCTGLAHLYFWFGPSPSLLWPYRSLRMSQNWPDLWSWGFSVKPEAEDWFSFQLTALCPQESLLLRWPTKLAYRAGLYMSPQPYVLTFRDMSLSGNWPTVWLYFSWRSEATVMSSLTFGSGWENRVTLWLFQCEDFHSVCRSQRPLEIELLTGE